MKPTPPIILDAIAVESLLPNVDVLGELRSMFAALGHGLAVQPPQSLTLFPEDKGDFITYLGAVADSGVFGAKLSPYLVTEDVPIITAWTVLMSMQSGQPLMMCDSGVLTTERTAATTALAVDLLTGEEANQIAIIGSGAVAQAHWRHVQALRPWQKVKLYSPSLGGNRALRDTWKSLCTDIEFADTAENAAKGADVVMLCTSSGTPVLEESCIAPHALVTSISTNVAQAHEIAPSFLNSAQVYCDYRATTPTTAGEMVLAAKECGWSSDLLCGDLGELLTDRCSLPNTKQPVFFRSVGLGLEDIAIAHAIYRANGA
ncbi:ornithine cyclodeaminase family protein [Cochlodiniinecator piscidefendens]|uniref:ornithine cyclodeaminase family protein n=1 Tax=Cochlodiniinecator piscidefendens TaxID=2715756 RepID=UPI00140B69B9|nr:ornithine cyclodeaminase family protein [Cochlodiniinecator piscidefendens]